MKNKVKGVTETKSEKSDYERMKTTNYMIQSYIHKIHFQRNEE